LCCWAQVVVVKNAVSDVRGTFQMGVPADNQGGAYVRREAGEVTCDRHNTCPSNVTTIVMDDLLEVVDFRQAVIKIDVEGHECRAFFHADRLFDNINIPYVFMEWVKLRGFVASIRHLPSTDNQRLRGVQLFNIRHATAILILFLLSRSSR